MTRYIRRFAAATTAAAASAAAAPAAASSSSTTAAGAKRSSRPSPLPPLPFPFPGVAIGIDVCQVSRIYGILSSQGSGRRRGREFTGSRPVLFGPDYSGIGPDSGVSSGSGSGSRSGSVSGSGPDYLEWSGPSFNSAEQDERVKRRERNMNRKWAQRFIRRVLSPAEIDELCPKWNWTRGGGEVGEEKKKNDGNGGGGGRWYIQAIMDWKADNDCLKTREEGPEVDVKEKEEAAEDAKEETDEKEWEEALRKASVFLAGRWAAKEAAIKAHPWRGDFEGMKGIEVTSGLSLSRRIGWRESNLESKLAAGGAGTVDGQEVGIPRDWKDQKGETNDDGCFVDRDNGSDAPVVVIRGGTNGARDQIALVSISHDGDYATAVCVGFDPTRISPFDGSQINSLETGFGQLTEQYDSHQKKARETEKRMDDLTKRLEAMAAELKKVRRIEETK